MKKAIAEFVGTFTLVFLGCATIVVSGGTVHEIGIAFAFGLTVVAMAYGIGPVSGAHLNPAVSLGVLFAGRMSIGDFIMYVIGQVAGAIAAAVVLKLIMSGNPASTGALGVTTFKDYGVVSAFLFEAIATFLFLVTILGVTQKGAPSHLAGLAIGLALVLIHLAGMPISGASVNPARSIGPALISGDANAIAQLWLYVAAPAAGAAVAGILFASGLLAADDEG